MNKEKLKKYRISPGEYDKICEILGREPKGVEWALFSALWSEHCSYKSSRIHLKKFATTMNSQVVTGEGENAGVVDLGQGERLVFKMESHNHPSFIEPYQGAATGVGGILRDIFTMGARPIASADFLCFGDLQAPRMKSLVDGVVRGIGGYGNSVGVPTVTGKTQFDSDYNQNILVNAMSVGLLEEGDQLALSKVHAPGAWVVYVGAMTGKDGVHGAAMASESFDEDSDSKKPNVQIGDPYFEKLLIESCLEVIQKGLVLAIQDMGAAGLTSSSFEMAAKGGLGFDLDLSLVPVRDSSIGPEEILLSESQERMLLVCEPAKFPEIKACFETWGLSAVKVGVVRTEPAMKISFKNELLTEIDPAKIVDQAPVFDRSFHSWRFPKWRTDQVADAKKEISRNESQELLNQIGRAENFSRAWIYQQFDQRVGGKTVRGADESLAVLRLPTSGRGLAMAVGCRTSIMKMDAYLGASDAVAEPLFKMALKGFSGIGITDCLNFGNPEKTDVMTEFVASVEAIRDVALEFKIPVVSGNVSFYNETLGKGIPPTPACGVLGLRPQIDKIPKDHLSGPQHDLWLISTESQAIGNHKWWGAKSVQGLKAKFDFLRNWINENQPIATLPVGIEGVGIQLLKSISRETGFSWDAPKDHYFEKKLYSGILELKAPLSETAQKEFKQNGFSVLRLGTTISKDVKTPFGMAACETVLERRDQAWRIEFENMER